MLNGAQYGEPLPDEPVWVTEVQCSGSESDLDECNSVVLASDGDSCIGGDINVMCEGESWFSSVMCESVKVA